MPYLLHPYSRIHKYLIHILKFIFLHLKLLCALATHILYLLLIYIHGYIHIFKFTFPYFQLLCALSTLLVLSAEGGSVSKGQRRSGKAQASKVFFFSFFSHFSLKGPNLSNKTLRLNFKGSFCLYFLPFSLIALNLKFEYSICKGPFSKVPFVFLFLLLKFLLVFRPTRPSLMRQNLPKKASRGVRTVTAIQPHL